MLSRRAFCSSVRKCSQRSPEEIEAYKRKRKAEWKRKQGGNTFLDHLIVTVRGGKGGDGCAAFHREKFKPFGPPSGGSGGRGGNVYFQPTPALTTLSTIPTRIRGNDGENGKGTWQNGKAAEPLVIKVPLGTVVKELGRDDPRRAHDEWESEEEAMRTAGLGTNERMELMRQRRWVHYPGYEEINVQRDDFREQEREMYRMERERRLGRRKRLDQNPIFLDLDKYENPNASRSKADIDNAPLGIRRTENLGHLIAEGGQGGVGNPHFVSITNRVPRFATRGQEGDRVTLFLELKLLADIGFVGMPNAGKSTLLRALTGGRAKTDVAGYAFTTLNPVVGIVRVADDGTFEGELVPEETVYDETKLEEETYEERMKRGDFAHSPTRNQINVSSSDDSSPSTPDTIEKPTKPGHYFDLYESFRFTIADNPGLIENSASPFAHAGLGHSFLRAIERSPALACVVDFSVTSSSPQSQSAAEVTTDAAISSNVEAVEDSSTAVTSESEINSTEPTEEDLDLIDTIPVDVEPREAIRILKNELETYQEGMSSRIRMVIANKADLVATPSSSSSSVPSAAVEEAKGRLQQLEEYVKKELGEDVIVVPVSGKYRMNLRKVVALMQGFVQEARDKQAREEQR